MEFWHLLIVLPIITPNNVLAISSNELLELSCNDDMQCKQFQQDGIKPKCMDGHCQCINSADEHVKCKPMNNKLSNIIGGNCPCNQPNAECYQNRCYCAIDFIPSSDKRRCLKRTAFLGDSCELDAQCQNGDYNAICPSTLRRCSCMEQFANHEQQCLSKISDKFKCTTTAQCLNEFGSNSQCDSVIQRCLCSDGFVTALNNSMCLTVSKYLADCEETSQCINTMGPGAKCTDRVCQCDVEYYPEVINNTKTGTTKTVCTREAELGQYCRVAKDCSDSERTMDCVYGECCCKFGFYSINDGICMRSDSISKFSQPTTFLHFVFFVSFIRFLN